MPINSDPTTLEVYYCQSCLGIIATTDISKINKSFPHNCPFCLNSSLHRLEKEVYGNNFDFSTFPSPQSVILEKFFKYADNTLALLTAFQNVPAFETFSLQLENFSDFTYTYISIKFNYEITIKLEGTDNVSVEIQETVLDIVNQLQ